MRVHAISCFSFLDPSKWQSQVENADFRIPRISWILSSDFYKSNFFIFTYSQIRKLGLQKIRNFQTSEFSIFAFRFSNIHLFDICLLSNTKTWISKIRDFQTSVFSIFAYSQIRKLGSQKSEISKRPEEHPAFLMFINIKIQKLRFFRK